MGSRGLGSGSAGGQERRAAAGRVRPRLRPGWEGSGKEFDS